LVVRAPKSMAITWSSCFAGPLRNGNAMGRFYLFRYSIASTTKLIREPGPSEQLPCSGSIFPIKRSGQGWQSLAPGCADHNRDNVVPLEDTAGGRYSGPENPRGIAVGDAFA